ncbi:hypothetical protein AB6Q56_14565 [Dechloromonas sp. ARDL1]|uniref:hypothetical protein n=1 Tax=Dechloromonas sp. ARDL1 TaxID=3322121 RepID=UPI003DA743EC
MARPKTEYLNEMKTRVPDPVFEGVKAFQEENGFDSESRAISKLLEIALFGTVGTLPTDHLQSSPGVSQSGPLIRA